MRRAPPSVRRLHDAPPSDARAERVGQIVAAATKVFLQCSYRRAQMADIARELGVSPGTLYNYFESKEALFHRILEQCVHPTPLPVPDTLPCPTPAPGSTVALLERLLEGGAQLAQLDAALKRKQPDDPRAELEAVLRELYAFVSRHRETIVLIERSAPDWPELDQIFYKGLRRSFLHRLETYLDRRMRAGWLRSVPDRAAAARLANETIAWFAMHRLHDRDSVDVSDASAEDTVIDVLVHAFCLEP